ncbi:PhzA/PhzB family protein [Burkholderia ubonensis]|uniref:PhzA/PhzB family protein n=1 Tax=Burkholderia ubonensis TaxID=101571 RepID=UPI002ABE3D98|nr:PhzA/PhzB family protein [Burkholderia ubonensis]
MSHLIRDERATNRAAVEAFLNVFPEGGESFFAARQRMGLLAPDYVMELPYAPPGMRRRDTSEHHNARADWLRDVFLTWRRTNGPVIYETTDPKVFWVEAGGEGLTRFWGTPMPYLNDFAIMFVVEDGKVKLFREYFNPINLYPPERIPRFPFGG